MYKKVLLLFGFILLISNIGAGQNTYFVSTDGNDANDGLSVQNAWKSIDKVNTIVFQPGDRILFKAGEIFQGQLKPQGSGTQEKPIVMSSFGGCGRPVIDLGTAEGAGILLENVSYWEIRDMEVTSRAPYEIGIGRQGIVITASGQGHNLKHFVIKDNYIHDIWGQMGGRGQYVGYYSSGILVRILRDRASFSDPSYKPCTIDDVLIENNVLERIDKCGIVCWGAKHDVIVRRNKLDNIGGDGIFVNGPYRGLIEYNTIHRTCMRAGDADLPGDDGWWPHVAACWIQNTEETIMQFNEVYDTGRNLYNGDGFAYDFDFNCKRCIAQYNYSKNNHGFMLLMYNIFENVTRYNISENDHTHLIQMQGPLEGDRSMIYNNVFYIDYGMADIDYFLTREPEKLGAKFWNNIFYATGQGRFRSCYTSGDTAVRKYDEELHPNIPSGSIFLNNCYFGPWKNGIPDDPKALVADPKFVAPGTGGNSLYSLGGYALKSDSPCINAGMYIPSNGGLDFFGQCVNDGRPDIGAFEFVGSGVFADKEKEAEQDKASREASSVAWAKWMFPEVIASNNPAALTIRLREPLTDDIKGTISWTSPKGKTFKVDLSKATDRQILVLSVKSDKISLEGSTVKVFLTNGSFSENFEVPVKEMQNKRHRL